MKGTAMKNVRTTDAPKDVDRKPGEVRAMLDGLDNTIDLLEERVNTLIESLNPVLSKDRTGDDQAEPTESAGPSSTLALEIRQQNGRVYTVMAAITEVIDHIEI
jgi:hypothetical protein